MDSRKILFVCMGNICRSPAAEGVMQKLVQEVGLNNQIEIDSAGTIGYHAGDNADPRMIKHASKRGYMLTSISRKFNPFKDFEYFDYIVTMDDQNYSDIKALDPSNKFGKKLYKMTSFCSDVNVREVPDPYYDGSEGFENVLDILEDSCKGLLETVKNELEPENQIKN